MELLSRLYVWICLSLCLSWSVTADNLEEWATLDQLQDMSKLDNIPDLCKRISSFHNTSECEKELNGAIDIGADSNKTLVSQASTIALFDACNPREQTVALPRDQDPRITVWPICTRVKRCGGCCTSDVFTCSPTETKNRYLKVFKTLLPYPGAHTFQFLGVRIVKLEEHTQCDAQCRVKEHECHKYQVYEPRKCRCRCRQERLNLKNKCTDNQVWDDDECNCICPNRNTIECPEPSVFSENTCKCTLKTSVTGEIDLIKLFENIDKGLYKIGKGDGGLSLIDTNIEKQALLELAGLDETGGGELTTDGEPPEMTEPTTSTTTSTTSTTTTTPTTTTVPTTTPDPCKGFRCPPWWVPTKLVDRTSARCQCMPKGLRRPNGFRRPGK